MGEGKWTQPNGSSLSGHFVGWQSDDKSVIKIDYGPKSEKNKMIFYCQGKGILKESNGDTFEGDFTKNLL